MLLILCFALAYAIQGSARQAWTDGSFRAGTALTDTRGAFARKVKQSRWTQHPRAKAAVKLSRGAVAGGRGLWRILAGLGSSVAWGWKRGWAEGRDRGEQRRADRYDTCPDCKHPYADETPDWCGCVNEKCPCSARAQFRTSQPPAPDSGGTTAVDRDPTNGAPTPGGPVIKTAEDEKDWVLLESWGDPARWAAWSDRDREITPRVAEAGVAVLDRDGAPMDISTINRGETSMTVTTSAPTGEAVGITQARTEINGFNARATTYLDISQQMQAEAQAAEDEAHTLVNAAEKMRASLAGQRVDSTTLAEIAGMQERAAMLASAAEGMRVSAGQVGNAADGLLSSSRAALEGLNSRHSGLEDAHKSAPDGGATREFYVA